VWLCCLWERVTRTRSQHRFQQSFAVVGIPGLWYSSYFPSYGYKHVKYTAALFTKILFERFEGIDMMNHKRWKSKIPHGWSQVYPLWNLLFLCQTSSAWLCSGPRRVNRLIVLLGKFASRQKGFDQIIFFGRQKVPNNDFQCAKTTRSKWVRISDENSASFFIFGRRFWISSSSEIFSPFLTNFLTGNPLFYLPRAMIG